MRVAGWMFTALSTPMVTRSTLCINRQVPLGLRIVHVLVSNPGELKETSYGPPCYEEAWPGVKKSIGNMINCALSHAR